MMTMIPLYVKCSRCKKKYSWNPDVGKMRCPRCGKIGMPGGYDLEKIWTNARSNRRR